MSGTTTRGSDRLGIVSAPGRAAWSVGQPSATGGARHTRGRRKALRVWVRRLNLVLLLALLLVGCGGDGVDRFVGTWVSDLDDRDQFGDRVSTAYRLTVNRDRSYGIDYRSRSAGEWRTVSTGTARPATVRLEGGIERAGIDLGANYAAFYGRKLHVQIGGELRTFEPRGLRALPCWFWPLGIVSVSILGGMLIRAWRERAAFERWAGGELPTQPR